MPAAEAIAFTVGARGSTSAPARRGHMVSQSLSRVDDSQLIREAQRGDRVAFEELVRQYDRAVLRLALHLTGSEADAQDIYQEAFLKAYRNIGSFRFECSFYTWVYRIVTNLCLDHLRKKQVRKEDAPVTTDKDGEEFDVLSQFADERPGAGPDAARAGRTHRPGHDQAHAARAHGLRAQTFPRAEAPHHRRDAEYD